jgi:flagellar hook-basal body complex protein FliE
MTTPTLTVTPSTATNAYARVQSGDQGSETAGSATTGFGATLQRALEGVVDAGHEADAQSLKAIAGGGNITEVVTAVSRAELALQSTVAIRDRVIQAYQEIMRMPI